MYCERYECIAKGMSVSRKVSLYWEKYHYIGKSIIILERYQRIPNNWVLLSNLSIIIGMICREIWALLGDL